SVNRRDVEVVPGGAIEVYDDRSPVDPGRNRLGDRQQNVLELALVAHEIRDLQQRPQPRERCGCANLKHVCSRNVRTDELIFAEAPRLRIARSGDVTTRGGTHGSPASPFLRVNVKATVRVRSGESAVSPPRGGSH